MTVTVQDARIQYTANAGDTIFSFPFEITDQTSLRVYSRIAGSTANDAADLLVLGSGAGKYIVTPSTYTIPATGTITLGTAALQGDIVTIEGWSANETVTSFTPAGALTAESLNTGFDNDILIQQSIGTIQTFLVPKYPESAVVSATKDIPLPILSSLESWRMNTGATAIETFQALDVTAATGIKFILQQASALVPSGQDMSALATGITKSTTGTGVQSIAVLGTDYYGPGMTVDIPVNEGGTGRGDAIAYSVICGGTTSTGAHQSVATVGTLNQALFSNGPGALPTWKTVPTAVGAALTRVDDANVTLSLDAAAATCLVNASVVTLGWTGQLGLTRGGTNASLTADDGAMVYSDATGMALLAATATAGQIIRSGSNAAPTWSTATYPDTATSAGELLRANGTNWVESTSTFADTYGASELLYSNGANAVQGLTTANNSILVTSAGGVPSWGTAIPTGITIADYLPLLGGTMTGAIDMGAQKITTTYVPAAGPDLTNKTYVDSVVGAGVTEAQIQNNAFTYAVDSGAADAYVIAPTPAVAGYADGQSFIMNATNTNTGASTINISGLGVIPLVNVSGSALIGRNILAGDDYYLIINGGGTEAVVLNANTASVRAQEFYDGAAKDPYIITVASDGATITATLQNDPTGDIEIFFSTGIYILDCTPALTATLTAGTDTVPVKNYIYILESTKAMTVSTVGWPSAEHMPVATVVCQSAASIVTQGVYSLHAWQDNVAGGSDDNGHFGDINYWIRQQSATWIDGVACTPTAGAGQFDVATSSGNVLQLHPHAYPAFDTGAASFVLVPNSSTAAYESVSDLSTILLDQAGSSLTNKYYNLVLWGVVSEDAGDCQLMCNLPNGTYTNSVNAQDDVDNTAIYTIPGNFRGTGFLIARLTVRNQSDLTWTIERNSDLRGLIPATASGAGIGGISAVVDDPAPLLGGNLGLNGNSIVAPSSTLSDFITSTSLTGAADTTGATSLAIKTYVDNSVAGASGLEGSMFLMGG